MNKRVFLFLLFIATSMQAAKSGLSFAMGPAWQKFASFQTYSLGPNADVDEIPFTEEMSTNYDVMSYAQGSMMGSLFGCVTAEITAGGGFLSKGLSTIYNELDVATTIFLPFQNNGSYDASLAIVDVNAGYAFMIPSTCATLNPIVGYMANFQDINIQDYDLANRYCLRNKWRGGYVGVGWLSNKVSNMQLDVCYKCAVGNVLSRLAVAPIALPLIAPDGDYSVRCASILANIIRVAFIYTYHEWLAGTSVCYMDYGSRSPGTVFLGEKNKVVQEKFIGSSVLQKISWQQLNWTLFLTFNF